MSLKIIPFISILKITRVAFLFPSVPVAYAAYSSAFASFIPVLSRNGSYSLVSLGFHILSNLSHCIKINFPLQRMYVLISCLLAVYFKLRLHNFDLQAYFEWKLFRGLLVACFLSFLSALVSVSLNLIGSGLWDPIFLNPAL